MSLGEKKEELWVDLPFSTVDVPNPVREKEETLKDRIIDGQNRKGISVIFVDTEWERDYDIIVSVNQLKPDMVLFNGIALYKLPNSITFICIGYLSIQNYILCELRGTNLIIPYSFVKSYIEPETPKVVRTLDPFRPIWRHSPNQERTIEEIEIFVKGRLDLYRIIVINNYYPRYVIRHIKENKIVFPKRSFDFATDSVSQAFILTCSRLDNNKKELARKVEKVLIELRLMHLDYTNLITLTTHSLFSDLYIHLSDNRNTTKDIIRLHKAYKSPITLFKINFELRSKLNLPTNEVLLSLPFEKCLNKSSKEWRLYLGRVFFYISESSIYLTGIFVDYLDLFIKTTKRKKDIRTKVIDNYISRELGNILSGREPNNNQIKEEKKDSFDIEDLGKFFELTPCISSLDERRKTCLEDERLLYRERNLYYRVSHRVGADIKSILTAVEKNSRKGTEKANVKQIKDLLENRKNYKFSCKSAKQKNLCPLAADQFCFGAYGTPMFMKRKEKKKEKV